MKPYIVDVLTKSSFFVNFDLFEWVEIMSAGKMDMLFTIMLIACVMVTVGLFFRISMVVIFFGWTYVFLLCKGHYNNHYYFYCLLSFLLIFTDADKWGSIKSFFKPQRRILIPYWQVFLLIIQVIIVYFYGAMSKLEDDWMAGYPMRIWLADYDNLPLLKDWLTTETAALTISYIGFVFDLLIGFSCFGKEAEYSC